MSSAPAGGDILAHLILKLGWRIAIGVCGTLMFIGGIAEEGLPVAALGLFLVLVSAKLIHRNRPGYYGGRPYREFRPKVESLLQQEEYFLAEDLLQKLVDTMRRESARKGAEMDPWFVEQLIGLLQRGGRTDEEAELLDDYFRCTSPPGEASARLRARLATLRS